MDALVPALAIITAAGAFGLKYRWDWKKWKASLEDIKTKFDVLQYHDRTLHTKVDTLSEILETASTERLQTQHGFLTIKYPPVIVTQPNKAITLDIEMFNIGTFAPQTYSIGIRVTKTNTNFEVLNKINGTLSPHERRVHNIPLKITKEGFNIFEYFAPYGKIGETIVFAVS
ncbi:MAG: hypothetical protein HY929_01290 [Euryarchaeota archaeon]|nr:hypothetical protein [Euryarchaeota archaeon]